jgi:transposase
VKVKLSSVKDSINKVRELLKNEKRIPTSLKAAVEVLILLVTVLSNRLNLNSSNSSKSPSMDPNRKRKLKGKGDKKAGGQNGHKGVRLKKFEKPDKIKIIKINKKTLPPGEYKEVGYESRQVVDMEIKRIVTEYRVQVLENEKGKKYVAPFPKEVSTEVQYGNNLKANSVYMSQFQLLPYNRIQDYFSEQMGIPLSSGSIFNLH